MLTKSSILEHLRDELEFLETEYGVKSIGIFGSIRSETFTDKSDIDLVVDFNRPIGLKFIELAEYLEKLFGMRVDLLTPAGVDAIRNPEILDSIKNSIEYVST